MAPLGLPFASQNLSKNRSRPPLEHRESLGACPGARGLPKATQNGAQSEPWTPKIRSLGTPRPPKRSSRHPQNIPKASQNSFPKMLLKLIQISFKKQKKNIKNQPECTNIGDKIESNMELSRNQILLHEYGQTSWKKCPNEAKPKEGGRRCVAVRRLR